MMLHILGSWDKMPWELRALIICGCVMVLYFLLMIRLYLRLFVVLTAGILLYAWYCIFNKKNDPDE